MRTWILLILVCFLAAASPQRANAGFVNNFDMFGNYTQYLYSTSNAEVITEGDGVTRYWAPTQTGVEAEIVYRYSLDFTIVTASVYGIILAITPDAQAYLDVSPDGAHWTNVEAGYDQYPPPMDVSSVLAGSDEAFVRARLFVESSDNFYSQFLRSAPYLQAPNVYQFEADPAAAPAPTGIVLAASGLLVLLGYGWRRRAVGVGNCSPRRHPSRCR